jgi:hypothetical protein
MAFLPALAAVGGGSAVAGALTVAGAAAGVYSAVQQRQAGIEASAEAKAQAKTEEVNSNQREIDRRRDLIRALSSQNAAAAAAGADNSGSTGAIMRRDIKDAQNDLLFSSVNSDSRQRALRSRASNAVKQGNAGAATSLLDTAGKLYKKAG